MLLNYIKLSFRLLTRNPFFTFINVVGLSVGYAVFFVLWQFSLNELQSDQFRQDWERIYRFGMVAKWSDDTVNWLESAFGCTDAAFSRQVADQYSEVEDMTRILFQKNFRDKDSPIAYVKEHGSDLFLTTEYNGTKKSFIETKVAYGDPNLFSFMSIPLVEGDERHVLELTGSVALSEKTAIKYFGTLNSVGKILLLNDKLVLTVTGVFKNLPPNTHLDFDLVISSENLKNQYDKITYTWMAPTCYYKLSENTDSNNLADRINRELRSQVKKIGFGDWQYGDSEVYLQSLGEMPFQKFRQDFYQTKSTVSLNIMKYSSIAILLLAWINYINLTISSTRKRMKEVAARKVIGATATDVIIQFSIDAIVVHVVSIALAMTIIQVTKMPMEIFFGVYPQSLIDISFGSLAIMLTAIVAGILVSGIYPALVALRENPGALFRHVSHKSSGYNVSAIFTTFQYCVAISIVSLVFSVIGQLEFVRTKDIGLDKAQTLVVDLPIVRPENSETRIAALVDALRDNSDLKELSVSQSVPGDETQQWIVELSRTKDGSFISIESNGGVDENFIDFYKIRILAGRNFIRDNPADKSSILISAATASRLGFDPPEKASGQKIYFYGKEIVVIGVFKDYKLRPLLNEGYTNYGNDPGLGLTYKEFLEPGGVDSTPRRISIRIATNKFSDAVSVIEDRYSEFFPGEVFNWYFLDEVIDGKYHQQLVSRNLITLFSFLLIGIACLGLLGMISNKVIEKTKEISIRKVFGARMSHICKILLSTTVWQVLAATVIGIPISYYFTHLYLEKFSDKITVEWWYYAAPILMLFSIMFATIASVLFKVAKRNPVVTLKHE